MWSRSRVSDNGVAPRLIPAHTDGVDLYPGPVRLDWTAAEVTSYRFFFPQQFTPAYSYPLVVFVHDEHSSDADLDRWFPQVSDQNFLAAAVRAPFPHSQGLPNKFSWHKQPLRIAAKVIDDAVSSITALWKVHPERMYLMGEGLGGALAWQLALSGAPYAGAIAISPDNRLTPSPSRDHRLVKRLFIVQSDQATPQVVTPEIELTVIPHLPPRTVLTSQINHWLMSAIPGTVW